jgi:hypothetical protein
MILTLRRAGALAALCLLASRGTAQTATGLTAILTQLGGQVTLSRESQTELRFVRRATARQIVQQGEAVHLPAGAQATVICSTERLVRLAGPLDWTLQETACGRGLLLPQGAYRDLAAYAGRILPRQGVLLLELATRSAEPGLGPVLLSPRHTAVMDAHPRLVWTMVPDAYEYEIELRGPVALAIRVAAADLDCGQGLGAWRGLETCRWTPGAKWPALTGEEPLFLRLGYRRTATAPVHQAREMVRIELLPRDRQRGVQADLQRIATLPLDRSSRLLLAAGAYARAGLYADAIATYEEALQAIEMPEGRVTLGDLYLASGLTALAKREYEQALAAAPDPAARAAAELGLGYAAYFRHAWNVAQAHFERAHELYASLGFPAEADDAATGAARARGYGSGSR